MFRLPLGNKNKRWQAGLAAGGLAVVLAVAALTPFASHAQSDAAVITIAVQDQQKELYNNTIIPAFEKDNPNIIVQTVSQTAPNVPPAASNVSNFLGAIQSFVSQSDVILVSSSDVTAESTRAGYFLNLQPLID